MNQHFRWVNPAISISEYRKFQLMIWITHKWVNPTIITSPNYKFLFLGMICVLSNLVLLHDRITKVAISVNELIDVNLGWYNIHHLFNCRASIMQHCVQCTKLTPIILMYAAIAEMWWWRAAAHQLQHCDHLMYWTLIFTLMDSLKHELQQHIWYPCITFTVSTPLFSHTVINRTSKGTYLIILILMDYLAIMVMVKVHRESDTLALLFLQSIYSIILGTINCISQWTDLICYLDGLINLCMWCWWCRSEHQIPSHNHQLHIPMFSPTTPILIDSLIVMMLMECISIHIRYPSLPSIRGPIMRTPHTIKSMWIVFWEPNWGQGT